MHFGMPCANDFSASAARQWRRGRLHRTTFCPRRKKIPLELMFYMFGIDMTSVRATRTDSRCNWAGADAAAPALDDFADFQAFTGPWPALYSGQHR